MPLRAFKSNLFRCSIFSPHTALSRTESLDHLRSQGNLHVNIYQPTQHCTTPPWAFSVKARLQAAEAVRAEALGKKTPKANKLLQEHSSLHIDLCISWYGVVLCSKLIGLSGYPLLKVDRQQRANEPMSLAAFQKDFISNSCEITICPGPGSFP